MYVIIIILIVVLIIAAIFINAMQQARQQHEAERRAELAKQRTIVEETENVLNACTHMPVSPKIVGILHNRMANALKAIDNIAPTRDVKQRIESSKQAAGATLQTDGSASVDFVLPDNDKTIIQYIQAVKKLRVLLRSEHSKGQVGTKLFSEEDRHLERLQVKVNVETLIKRGRNAQSTNMLGSARQYFEKAKVALENQPNQDEYISSKLSMVNSWLHEIQSDLKSVNEKDRVRKQEEERDELDELFAPKKKW